MSLFKFFAQQDIYQNDLEAVHALIDIAAFGGDESKHERANMDTVLQKVEAYITDSSSALLLYWLGIAWRNYTSWHIRGDERKPYLEKTIQWFKKTFEQAQKQELPKQLPFRDRHEAEKVDLITIAGEIGSLYVNEAIVRDLDQGEKYLGFVSDNTWEYEPCLCLYAELFYKREEYEKATQVALNAHERATKSPQWENDPPPAPLTIAAKAYRALGKATKKEKRYSEAAKWFQKIVELDRATDNDKKLLRQLLELVKT